MPPPTDQPKAERAMETRGITCPHCDPDQTDPDFISGYALSLKYLIFGSRCKNCGTDLVDLGPMSPATVCAKGE